MALVLPAVVTAGKGLAGNFSCATIHETPGPLMSLRKTGLDFAMRG